MFDGDTPDLDMYDPSPETLGDLMNALVAEWKQIPAAMFQHLLESLPRRVEAVNVGRAGVHILLAMQCSSS